jgi:SagB-type dehydrogenase family enzyme
MTGGADALRAYHERTKHTPERLRTNPHGLDWPIMPRPFKVYADLDPIPLPRDFLSSTQPALASIAGDGSPLGRPAPLDRGALARLLHFSAGVLRHRRYAGGEIFFRAAACTGALYHVDLYVVCARLADLEAGVYHFGPHDFALRCLRAGDHRGVLQAATGGHPAVGEAPVLLLYTSTFWRNAWKYRERAYRHCFWDAGTILANLLALSTASALPATVVQGFVDADVNVLLDLDTAKEVTLGVVALGSGAAAPPAAPAIRPRGLTTLPPSAREVDYAAIREAHEASQLGDPVAVTAWRSAPPIPSPAATVPAEEVALDPPPASTVAEPIETVILRRGSTRDFSDESITASQLAALVHAATRAVPGDVVPAPELYLLVHAVEGLAPGTYVATSGGRSLVPLRAGVLRQEAGFLGLGQRLPAEAAVNLYWLIDLERVFARYGGRGYRAAQLAAAIAGGRTYLAAYAQGLGATGLTFFDDEVTSFFSPRAAGKSVLFLVAAGWDARRSARRQ